jgi:hypothetical protein
MMVSKAAMIVRLILKSSTRRKPSGPANQWLAARAATVINTSWTRATTAASPNTRFWNRSQT